MITTSQLQYTFWPEVGDWWLQHHRYSTLFDRKLETDDYNITVTVHFLTGSWRLMITTSQLQYTFCPQVGDWWLQHHRYSTLFDRKLETDDYNITGTVHFLTGSWRLMIITSQLQYTFWPQVGDWWLQRHSYSTLFDRKLETDDYNITDIVHFLTASWRLMITASQVQYTFWPEVGDWWLQHHRYSTLFDWVI